MSLARRLPLLALAVLAFAAVVWAGYRADVLGPDSAIALFATCVAALAFLLLARLHAHVRRIDLELRIQARSLESAGIGLVITDARKPDHPIVYVNSAFERLTGHAREEVLGKNCRFLNRLAREQPELDELRRAIRSAKPCTVVLQNHTKSGVLFWNELRLSPVLDERGITTHFIGVQTDVTGKVELAVEAEASLRSAREDRMRAAEAMRARDVLLATVSHELRSPLNSIRLWASVLRADASPDPATTKRAIAQIESSVDSQNRLINDLLDVSRFVSGKLELDRRRIDLSLVAAEVVHGLRPAAAARGLALELARPERTAAVDADRVRIAQVVRNLLDNALKFTPRGGRIEVSVLDHESEIELRVKDDGAGITADHLPRIFDQFWQAHMQSGRRYGGLGLGLSIVRHVVERHGGTITAASDGPGRGSTFTVRLPVSAAVPVAAERKELRTDAGVVSPGDVLVVEDERDTAEALALALRMRGLEVRIALDVGSALEAIASRRPRVLVSDLILPERTGFDLIRALREEESAGGCARIHAIAISGLGNQADDARVRRAGFDVFLRKPLSVEGVFRCIADALAALPA